VYHLFPVRSLARAEMQAHLQSNGVETLIHYPVPIPCQPVMGDQDPAECPVANRIATEVLSLPLYPGLPEDAIRQVVDALASGPSAAVSRHERHAHS
jgi:dTDP-4-amino-4,6-dideoxygalactose transaminase